VAAPDFVVVGHVSRDIVADGWRLGGTATFAAVQAHRLGRTVGVVTRAGNDVDVARELSFATVIQQQSPVTTTFENHYERGVRKQRAHARAAEIVSSDVPIEWRDAGIILIGPVLGAVDPALATIFADGSLVGVSPQGWLRDVDRDGNVMRIPWKGKPFWRGADAIFVSDEDLIGGRDDALVWTTSGAIIALTESHRGAQIWSDGIWRRMPAFPEEEVDPTGAGDTFATAFLIRLHEGAGIDEAARFGAAAASLSIGGIGAAAMPSRDQIEERMRQHPEVVLR
jgi:pfkB family carbohydrate kinase